MWNYGSDKESYWDFIITAACQVSHIFDPPPDHSFLLFDDLLENKFGGLQEQLVNNLK